MIYLNSNVFLINKYIDLSIRKYFNWAYRSFECSLRQNMPRLIEQNEKMCRIKSGNTEKRIYYIYTRLFYENLKFGNVIFIKADFCRFLRRREFTREEIWNMESACERIQREKFNYIRKRAIKEILVKWIKYVDKKRFSRKWEKYFQTAFHEKFYNNIIGSASDFRWLYSKKVLWWQHT